MSALGTSNGQDETFRALHRQLHQPEVGGACPGLKVVSLKLRSRVAEMPEPVTAHAERFGRVPSSEQVEVIDVRPRRLPELAGAGLINFAAARGRRLYRRRLPWFDVGFALFFTGRRPRGLGVQVVMFQTEAGRRCHLKCSGEAVAVASAGNVQASRERA